MENMSSVDGFMPALIVLLQQYPVLQQLTDIAVKSTVLLTLFWMLDALAGNRLSAASRHMLWLYALLCLPLLPLMPVFFALWQSVLAQGAVVSPPGVLFELSSYAGRSADPWQAIWLWTAVMLYLIPMAVLLARLVLALRGLVRLRRQSIAVSDAALQVQLQALSTQLGISRAVTLSVNPHIESPVSFGLFRPRIMLPAQAHTWTSAITTDVLLHELCHIKRLDWLTTLSAHMIATLFWFNPLVWLAVRRLRAESENSCDAAVLHSGRSDTDYAESLLGVAVSCIHARRNTSSAAKNNRTNRTSHSLVQTMLDQNTLKTRISRVLEEKKMSATMSKKQVRGSIAALLLVSVASLTVMSSHQVLYAQPQPDPATRTNTEMYPLNNIQPRYPTVAADAGIEGWAQVSFTVNADGTVADNSVSVVDAEPADIFNNSAIAAAKLFTFSPRMVEGEPVDVPNVQYVFRYYMTEASERAATQAP